VLRLRGGGGTQIFFLDLQTGQTHDGWWGEHSHKGSGIYEAICKKTSIRRELLVVKLLGQNMPKLQVLKDNDDIY